MKVEREKKEVTNSIVPYSFLNHRMTPCLFVTVAVEIWLDSHSIDEFVVVGSGCDEAVE